MVTGARIYVLSDGTDGDHPPSACLQRELSVVQALLSYPATHIDAVCLFVPDDLRAHLPASLTADDRLRVTGYRTSASRSKAAPDKSSARPSLLRQSRDNFREMTAMKKVSRTSAITTNLLDAIARDTTLPQPKGIVTTSTTLLAALTLSERHRAASVFVLASNAHAQMSYFPHTGQSVTSASRAAYLVHQTYHVANASRRLRVSPDDDHWHSLTHIAVYRQRYFDALPALNKWRRRHGMQDMSQLPVINALFGAPPIHVIVNVPTFLVPCAAPAPSPANLLLAVGHLTMRGEPVVDADTSTFLARVRADAKADTPSRLVTVVVPQSSAPPDLSEMKAGGATHVLILSSSSSNTSITKPSARGNRALAQWVQSNVHVCPVHPVALQGTLAAVLPASAALACNATLSCVVAAIAAGVPLIVMPTSAAHTFWGTLVTLRGLAVSGRPSDIKVLLDAALSARMRQRASAASDAFARSLDDDADDNERGDSNNAASSSDRGATVEERISKRGARAVAQLIIDKTF